MQPQSRIWGWLPEINHSVASGEIVCRRGELVIECKNQSCGAAMPIVPAEQDWCTMLLACDLRWTIKPVYLTCSLVKCKLGLWMEPPVQNWFMSSQDAFLHKLSMETIYFTCKVPMVPQSHSCLVSYACMHVGEWLNKKLKHKIVPSSCA